MDTSGLRQTPCAHGRRPWVGFPRHSRQRRGEQEEATYPREAQLTWGATIVQSLANSTCPERAKTMMFRKLVNHITHSKSATSWTVRAGRRQAGEGSGEGRASQRSCPMFRDSGCGCRPRLTLREVFRNGGWMRVLKDRPAPQSLASPGLCSLLTFYPHPHHTLATIA